MALMARAEKGSATYNQRSPESTFGSHRAKTNEQTLPEAPAFTSTDPQLRVEGWDLLGILPGRV